METTPSPIPSQFTQPPKKGLGTGAKIGIGCGGLVVLIIIGVIIAGIVFGPKAKQLAQDLQKNPTRTTATMMVSVSGGKMELVAQDDANKRYTVKDTKSGILTTIYWDEKKQAPAVIKGDFSAIPTAETTTTPEAEPVPAAEEK